MNLNKLHLTVKWRIALVIGCCALLTGCWQQRKMFWSPNGKQAALISENNLYLCDAEGKLSGLLVSNVADAAWLPDSERLILTLELSVTNWPALASVATPGMLGSVTNAVAALLERMKADTNWTALLGKDAEKEAVPPAAAWFYLRDCRESDWRALPHSPLPELPTSASVYELHPARAKDQQITLGPALFKSFHSMAVRPCPKADFLAFVDDRQNLQVTPLDASQPPVLVEAKVAYFPDWTADGLSLAYIHAADPSHTADIKLGAVARRRVINDAGHLELADKAEDLAGLLFDDFGRVRCLKDGRILFSTVEIHLPLTVKDMPQRELLFALDPERQATVTRLIPREMEERLPTKLYAFELSPDEKKISLWAEDSKSGEVGVLTLATGNLDTINANLREQKAAFVPSWRFPDEVCLAYAPEPGKTNETPRLEIGLWKDGKTRCLSRDWPTNVVEGLVK